MSENDVLLKVTQTYSEKGNPSMPVSLLIIHPHNQVFAIFKEFGKKLALLLYDDITCLMVQEARPRKF